MLPRATESRNRRDSSGKVSGRSQEIQRLIGRALRASVDLSALNEKSITIDCDVIEADGGTRTAAITGGFIALHECLSWMLARGLVKTLPVKDFVGAIFCGIYKGQPVLDLDYAEDVEADTDANFVMTGRGGLIEIQGTAEKEPFTRQELNSLLELADKGIAELIAKQKALLA
jgi:ribonuclease PH